MKASRLLDLPTGLLVLFALPAAAQLPYNPTRAFLSQHDRPLVYVFQPSTVWTSQFQLLVLDLASKLTIKNLSYRTLYPSLPFLDIGVPAAFTPVIDSSGNITVYTGNCSLGGTGSSIWRFEPDARTETGNGTWKQDKLFAQRMAGSKELVGANYLASGISFSSKVNGGVADTSIYMFGGMCPTNTSQDSWQSAATYSNLMLALDPISSSAQATEYDLGLTASRGPPVAEAGSSITALAPTYTNASDGTQTQQENFVLLGGHTKSAFINMSQVALFSLPQQTWTFLPVDQPLGGHTDLTVRDTATAVDPRSGHTAVLTPDGSKIVVFGGWVGDTNTPATPQLAVLNVGAGYGGSGDWTWSIPKPSGLGPATGSGVYGHGAVMLPGGVMMVVGGYSMSGSSSVRRRATQVRNTQNFFYNVTSNTWLSGYTPSNSVLAGSDAAESGHLTTKSQKAGLGAGLGIGALVVLALVVFYFWYTRRLKKQRDLREKELRELALGARRLTFGDWTTGSGRSGMSAADFAGDRQRAAHETDLWSNGIETHQFENQGWRRANGHDAERTGLLVEIPSPTRGLRKNHARGNYHAAPRYDEKRMGRGSGGIHPIQERDEEESSPGREMSERSRVHRISAFSNAPTLDPFRDPDPLRSNPVEMQAGRSRSHSNPGDDRRYELNKWAGDWEKATESLLHSMRATSPTKSSDRTSSNLSENSTRSNLSNPSHTWTFAGSLSRTLSARSNALLNTFTNPFTSPADSPASEHSPAGRRSPFNFTSSGFPIGTAITTTAASAAAAPPRSPGSHRPGTTDEADTFTTAYTTARTHPRPENDALLPAAGPGANSPADADTSIVVQPLRSNRPPVAYRDNPDDAAAEDDDDDFVMPRLTPQPQRSRTGWLGSMRRVLSRRNTARVPGVGMGPFGPAARSVSYDTHTRPGLRSRDGATGDGGHGAAMAERGPTATRPGQQGGGVVPRRAASDASFWRSRRGARDWDVPSSPSGGPATGLGLGLAGALLGWPRNSGDDWGEPTEDVDDELAKMLGEDVVGGKRKGKGEEEEEEDWDVEAAAERRLVQVMFTVPKQRLRVVNADADAERGSLMSNEGEGKEGDGGPGTS